MKGPAEIAHGPMLIGLVFNVLLYGIMIAQTYLYYTTYKRDRTWLKLLVFAVFLADTVNTIFDVIYLYESLILHFGDVDFLRRANWEFATDPVTTGIIALMVQLFFAWRIYVLTRNVIMISTIVGLSLASGACAIASTYEVIIIPDFMKFQEFKSVVIIWLACASAADIMITSTLVWYLRSHKTGLRSSDMMVDRIIRITMQTGLLTSLVAIIDLIVYLTDPTGAHLLLNFPLCKLYSNSLISSLNSRGGWRYNETSVGGRERTFRGNTGEFSQDFEGMRGGWKGDSMPSPRSPLDKAHNYIGSLLSGNKPKPEVFVHVESHEMRDVVSTSKSTSMNPAQDSHASDTQTTRNGSVVFVIPPVEYPTKGQTREPSLTSLGDNYLPDTKTSQV